MSIDQRKIALINWITNLDEEALISKIESHRKNSLNDLPKEIVKLLEISDSADGSECKEHTNARALLDM